MAHPVEQDGPHPLRPVQRARLYEQLVERLLTFVAQEGLLPGQRLPPERELSARLGVSRASVRQAIVALEVLGIVGVRQGAGMYLLRQADARASVAQLVERRQRLPEILEAREALEVKITELAAVRRTDEDLAAMDRGLETMEAEIAEGEPGLAGDLAFHGAVTDASHNPVLKELMNLLATAIEETRRESLSQPGRPRKSLTSHREIADAIRAQDPVRAVRAAQDHISLVGNVALLTWTGDGQ